MSVVRALVLLMGPLLIAAVAGAQECPGDCDANGRVTVDELVRGVNIAPDRSDLARCTILDSDSDGRVRVNELVTAVGRALAGCTAPQFTATPTPTATDVATTTNTPSPTATLPDGTTAIAEIVRRDTHGIAVHLGETVTAQGVVTVDAGAFGNNLLKIYLQVGNAGVKVFHQTSANVEAFEAGEELRVTGVVRQIDQVGGDVRNDGTIQIDISAGSAEVVSQGNTLPAPTVVTVAELLARGIELTGTLVRVNAPPGSGRMAQGRRPQYPGYGRRRQRKSSGPLPASDHYSTAHRRAERDR